MRRSPGASASWRSSQLMRGFARPSRGASIVTPVSVRRARRSARIRMSPIASGTRRTATRLPSAASCLTDSSSRAAAVWPRGRGEVTERPRSWERPEAQVLRELLPALGDASSLRVVLAQRPVVRGLADRDPLVAHVLEPAGARRLAVQVGDQLAEDPRLVGIGDAAVAVLDDRLGQHPPPREVPQRGPLELAAVDADRRLRRRGGDLVGDRQDAVEAVLACDVEVGVDLLGPQRGAGGLDLDQARPHLLPAPAHDRAVRDDGLARRVLEADLGERLDHRRLRRSELLEQRVAELRHRAHHRQQR